MASKYKIVLADKKELARATMAFYFSKPKGFEYKAGQSMDLTLINPPETDAEGNTRTFTISAPPYENKLMISTRVRDTAFKRTLKNMETGTEVNMEGPFGSFTLPNSSERAIVFLTGGIGVTPALSIIKDATKKNLPHKIFLFYSNKTPADAIFLDEFKLLEEKNLNFTFIPTMTRVKDTQIPWNGETGYIDEKMLDKYLRSDIMNEVYFLSGPMNMVSAMNEVLTKAGVDTDNIRTEEFPGY